MWFPRNSPQKLIVANRTYWHIENMECYTTLNRIAMGVRNLSFIIFFAFYSVLRFLHAVISHMYIFCVRNALLTNDISDHLRLLRRDVT